MKTDENMEIMETMEEYDTIDINVPEALRILQEECAEVIQAVSKIFRFGDETEYPEGGPTNLMRLEEEIGDLEALTRILTECGYLNGILVEDYADRKYQKLIKWSNVFKKKS
jgi:NTP pyrophosphatase (non-canonical NTP hydrolase)